MNDFNFQIKEVGEKVKALFHGTREELSEHLYEFGEKYGPVKDGIFAAGVLIIKDLPQKEILELFTEILKTK